MIDHQAEAEEAEAAAAAMGPSAADGAGAAAGAAEADAFRPSESTTRMADGTLLRTLHWTPPADPWAMALIVHGLGEHAGRYPTVAAALTADGVDVHGYDHRGFGGSAGPRAYVDHWSRLHDDLQERVLALRAEQPSLPLIVWGHSLGGLIACGYVLSPVARPLPDLLVLSSPALDVEMPGWKRKLAGALNGIVPRMRVSNGPLGDGLSHDPAIRDAYARDPLRVGASTVHFGHEAFLEQARVRAAIQAVDTMPVPTYVFHGSDDPIIPVSASAILAGKGNVTRHVHPGLRHETHHEYQHPAVLAEVGAWLEARRPALVGLPGELGAARV